MLTVIWLSNGGKQILGPFFLQIISKILYFGVSEDWGGSIWTTERQLHSFLNERMILKNITLTYKILDTVFLWPKVGLDKKSRPEK